MAKRTRSESPRASRRAAAQPADYTGAIAAAHAPVPTGVAEPRPPAEEQIARRAYELYRERGGEDGYDLDDWLRAERELRDGRSS